MSIIIPSNNINDSRAWLNKLEIPVPFDDSKLISTVIKNYDRILQVIETFTNLSTLRKNLYSLSKFCKLAGEEEKYHALSSRYIQLGKEIREKNLLQERTPRQEEKQISFEEMIKLREFYHKDRLRSLKDNYAYLIMSLVTLEPPKRLEIACMKINAEPRSALYNSIWKKNDRWVMKIDHDKVCKLQFFKDNNELELSKELSDIIDESLDYFPRTYLLNDSLDCPMRTSNLMYSIKRITPNGSTNNDFRSAYITHFYSQPHNLKEKADLALRMRHSKETAELSYCKIG